MKNSSEPSRPDTSQIAPWMTRYNPPGLSQLAYRGGRYRRALSHMLAQLPTSGHEGAATGLGPLAALNAQAENDWAIALVRAWAAVTEVLGFYQERIVNEGYLRTATERRSVLELARMIGYESPPGLAASADLVFSVLTSRDEPSRQVVIPAGTAVQSVPGPGDLPQTFETSAEFTARSEWNALKPAYVLASDWPQYLRREATSARLIGTDTGLRPGDEVLMVDGTPAPEGAERPWLLVSLKTVQPFPERGYTLATWDELQAAAGSEPLGDPQAFVLRQQAALFGYTPGGVYCTRKPDPDSHPEANWAPAAIGLPQTAVRALIGTDQGVLLAGTGQGVFRSANQGATWQPVNVGLAQKDIHALSVDREGHLLAGTDDGHIYMSKDGGHNWTALSGEAVVLPPSGLAKLWSRGKTPLPKTVVRALATYSRGGRRTLVAATDEGVFRSGDQGKTWQPANKDLPKTDPKTGLASVVAWALAVAGREKQADLYAGTDAGVFRIREDLNVWLMIAAKPILALLGLVWPGDPQTKLVMGAFFLLISLIADMLVIGARIPDRYLSQLTAISLGKPVHALVVGQNGGLLAGTEQGLYRSNDNSARGLLGRIGHGLARFLLGDLARRWQPINAGLTNKDVRALAVDAQGGLLAGTGDGSVFRSRDNGDTWESFGTDLSLKPILAMWATKDRYFAAGLPAESPVESAWSPFQVEQKLVDLDKVYPDISPGSWVVLRDSQKPWAALYQVTKVEVVDSLDPARPGRLSRISVDRDDGLDGFDRGTALVSIQSELLPLLADRPLEQKALTFDRFVPDLKPGHKLIVTGQRMRARVLDRAADSLKLVSDDGLQAVALDPDEAYPVLGVQDSGPPGEKQWRLKDKTGFVGSVTSTLHQIVLEPAAAGDEIVGQVAEVESVDAKQSHTKLTLRSALETIYDPTTVTLYANVVRASHGQTVADELLGSSQGLKTHQVFLLKQRPLTYISSAAGRGAQSTLKIYIGGVSWQEVTEPDRLDQEKRTFMLRQDAQGQTAIIFGHGPQGSGIPSGTEPIIATYRQGLGRAGNVAAGSLHLLQTTVPGLKGVTNPLAASGGADPETMDEAQGKAPLSLRAMERLVSLTDYEDFARRFAGIGQAQARLISQNHRQWLHITVAGADGDEISKDSEVYQNLVKAINTWRACPAPPVQVDSFRRLFFDVRARVWIEPDHHARMAEIEAAAKKALKDAFAFDRREFGQPVAAAQVITLIQDIPGVCAVELEQLYQHGQAAQRHLLLEAQAARWDEDELRPAEMLVINPIDGIHLDLEIAA
jgi:photosystem II stability/assembly factor-like uncharacterized protein